MDRPEPTGRLRKPLRVLPGALLPEWWARASIDPPPTDLGPTELALMGESRGLVSRLLALPVSSPTVLALLRHKKSNHLQPGKQSSSEVLKPHFPR